MYAVCQWCDEEFTARSRTQRFCSKSHATQFQYRDHVRVPSRWGKRPPIDSEHRRLRAELLPAAIGRPCPMGCGRTLDRTSQLDHLVPRSQGGRSTRDNVRIICKPCNQSRGSQLGGRIAHAKQKSTPRRWQL